jgi:hypothetical protein
MSNSNRRFTPHALILTERSVPQPMFVAAAIGVERLLRVDLNAGAPPLTFAGQALRAVRRLPAVVSRQISAKLSRRNRLHREPGARRPPDC